MSQFTISDTNPNDDTGGGGCACSEVRTDDTHGPFVIFPALETSSNISPHVVICEGCICRAERALAPGFDVSDKDDAAIDIPDEDVEEIVDPGI